AAPGKWLWLACTMAALFLVSALVLAFLHFGQSSPARDVVRFIIAPPEKHDFSRSSWGVSPDSRSIVFAAYGPDGRFSLWFRSLDSVDVRPLAGTENATSPFWSPDSRFIAFGSAGKLKKIPASGGPVQTLCDAPNPVLGGSWNSRGVILFGGPVGAVIWRVPESGGKAVPVTALDPSRHETFHAYPSFLPDGQHFI